MNNVSDKKADLVLKNGQLINVFTSEVYPADVAIDKDRIVGVGDYQGEEEIDLNGRYITPGFIDCNFHLESSLLTLPELAKAIVPHGTTTIVCDPDELINVLGPVGKKYLLNTSKNLPLDILFTKLPGGLPLMVLGPSDHDSVTLDEVKEKLRAGMQIFIREGSLAKNMEEILPLITPANSRFFGFCTEALNPVDLSLGHINLLLKKAVEHKLDPVIAVQLATINAARYYNLCGVGAVAPGYYADINILSNLEDFGIDMVFKHGKLVANKGNAKFEIKTKKNKEIVDTIKVKNFEIEALNVKAQSDYAKTIELVSDKNFTKAIVAPIKKKGKMALSNPDADVLKTVVVERIKGSGKIGFGFVKGFGLKSGALATSVAHGSNNIICVGVDDEDILSAVRRVAVLGGGMVAVRGGLVLAELPLPIAGLLSDKALKDVLDKQKKLDKAIEQLDCKIHNPFNVLSYLSASHIPEIRLTDQGLVDVVKAKIIELFD